MNTDIGTRIRRIRINKEIDAKKIADEIGIRDTSFSKIEREGSNSVDTLKKIAKALGVEITELFEDKLSVAEPIEKGNMVTREEWLQGNRELIGIVKSEINKIREELSIKKNPYKVKAKSIQKGKKIK